MEGLNKHRVEALTWGCLHFYQGAMEVIKGERQKVKLHWPLEKLGRGLARNRNPLFSVYEFGYVLRVGNCTGKGVPGNPGGVCTSVPMAT